MMFRSVLRLAFTPKAPMKPVLNRAMSAYSGGMYPANMSADLATLGFASNLWLTERQMGSMGVTLKEDQRGKGFATTGPDGTPFMLYNAVQTSDPDKVKNSTGKTAAYNGITKEKYFGATEQVLNQNMTGHTQNEWIEEAEIQGLGLALKEGSTPVQVDLEFNDTVTAQDGTTTVQTRIVSKKYYNVSAMSDPAALATIRKMYPISVSTGKRYGTHMAITLLKSTMENKFDSPFWLTMSVAQQNNLLVNGTGVDIVFSDKVVTLYNASQTNNAAKVASIAYKAQFAPRSAVSGSPYPEPAQSALAAAALKKKLKSLYWVTERQAAYIGVGIKDGEDPTVVAMPEGELRMYNAQQTTDRAACEARFAKNKK